MASLVGDTLYQLLSEQRFSDPMNWAIITSGTQSVKRRTRTLKRVSESLHFHPVAWSHRSYYPHTVPEAGQKEQYSSWALFILIMLLAVALFASYMLQHKKIQAVHETVLSIFAGALLAAPHIILSFAEREQVWPQASSSN